LLLIPPAAVAAFEARLGLNVLYGDQWALVPVMGRIADGTVRLHDLYVQYNEHRLTSAILVIAALAFASGWDVRWELWLDVLLAAVCFWGLHRLALRGREGPAPWPVVLASFVTSCL